MSDATHEAPKCQNGPCTCPIPRDRAARGDRFCCADCAVQATEPGRPAPACGCGHRWCNGT